MIKLRWIIYSVMMGLFVASVALVSIPAQAAPQIYPEERTVSLNNGEVENLKLWIYDDDQSQDYSLHLVSQKVAVGFDDGRQSALVTAPHTTIPTDGNGFNVKIAPRNLSPGKYSIILDADNNHKFPIFVTVEEDFSDHSKGITSMKVYELNESFESLNANINIIGTFTVGSLIIILLCLCALFIPILLVSGGNRA